jgi:hypothetical protein
MQINKIDNSPHFQAKIIYGDKRIEKYMKASFMNKDTFSTLDKFSEIHPDSIVSINIKQFNNKDYLVAKNGITGATEKKFLGDSEIKNLENQNSFIDLIKKIMNKKSFWDKTQNNTDSFDATAIETKFDHKVFNLDK